MRHFNHLFTFFVCYFWQFFLFVFVYKSINYKFNKINIGSFSGEIDNRLLKMIQLKNKSFFSSSKFKFNFRLRGTMLFVVTLFVLLCSTNIKVLYFNSQIGETEQGKLQWQINCPPYQLPFSNFKFDRTVSLFSKKLVHLNCTWNWKVHFLKKKMKEFLW